MNPNRQRFGWLLAIAALCAAALPMWLGWPKPRSHHPAHSGVSADAVSSPKEANDAEQAAPATRPQADGEVDVNLP
jgi:hypothetical protein